MSDIYPMNANDFEDDGESNPYSLKGFQLEYQLGARR